MGRIFVIPTKPGTGNISVSYGGRTATTQSITAVKANGSTGSVVNPASQTYKASGTYSFQLSMTGNTGTVTYPTSITVKNSSGTTISGWSCTSGGVVTVPQSTNAGTYTVTGTVSIAASECYNATSGSKTWTITINKATNPMSISPTSKTIYSRNGYNLFYLSVSNHKGTPSASVNTSGVASVSSFDSTNSRFVVTYSSAGSVTITVTDPESTNYLKGTKTCSVTCVVDEELSTQYKDSTCTTEGVNTIFGVPSVSIGSGITAANSSATVSCSVTNDVSWWQKWKSGYIKGHSRTDTGTAMWRITSNGNGRFSHPSTGDSSLPVGSGGSSATVYNSGKSVSHSSMTTNTGTDEVVVTAYNISDPLNKSATASKSATNSLGTTKYKNTSGTSGYNITYVAPTVSIGSGITAAGGSATVTCTVTNNTDWYQKYTSGSYTGKKTGTEAGTARWRITSNGNSRFSHPSSGGSSLTVGGSSVTVYNTGTSVSHSSMTTNIVTDSVTVTAYNTGDTSKSSTASKSVTNYVTSITPKSSSNDNTTHFSYANIGAGATSATPSLSGGGLYTFTSGSTLFDSSGSPSFGGSASYTRTYTLSASQNGFTAVNGTTGVLTATNRGTTIGDARSSGTVTGNLVITYTHPSSVGSGKVTSSTKTSTATCTQNANALTGITFTVNSSTISYGGSTTGTVTASYTSGSTKNVSNDANTSYVDNSNPDIVSFTKNS